MIIRVLTKFLINYFVEIQHFMSLFYEVLITQKHNYCLSPPISLNNKAYVFDCQLLKLSGESRLKNMLYNTTDCPNHGRNGAMLDRGPR